jgi:GT2 family glycosyltransferase
MYFSRAIRHLDRGSGECDIGQYSEACSVSGASGACLMLERSVVCALLLQGERHDKDVFKIYPALEENYLRRAPLFDEAFFAYREDADLAWRASILGCRTHFAPSVVGYHRRRVTPENRASLPPEINRWSVRNRFLMQINNFSIRRDATALWRGVILRNCLVVAGVALRERSSLGAFKDLAILLPRALERRRLLFKRANNSQLRNMFSNR